MDRKVVFGCSLADWPELVEAFAEDLGRCLAADDVRALLCGFTDAEKRLIYAACPELTRRRLWRLRQAEQREEVVCG